MALILQDIQKGFGATKKRSEYSVSCSECMHHYILSSWTKSFLGKALSSQAQFISRKDGLRKGILGLGHAIDLHGCFPSRSFLKDVKFCSLQVHSQSITSCFSKCLNKTLWHHQPRNEPFLIWLHDIKEENTPSIWFKDIYDDKRLNKKASFLISIYPFLTTRSQHTFTHQHWLEADLH